MLSWVELSQIVSDKISKNDDQNLTSILENVQALNESYATKPLYFDRIDACVKELSALVVDKSTSKEHITKKMQQLRDVMQKVVESETKPLMFNQHWFMERMKALGYNIVGTGECYGMSWMVTQAFLAKDMKTFNQRLQTIYDTPIDDFKNDFARLREKKQQLFNDGKSDEAAEINQKIVDIYAFFDGVALHQRPNIYLYDEDNQPISREQNILKTMHISTPIALEKHKNKPSVIATFTGFYNKKDLKNYLNLLKSELGHHSFSLSLASCQHAITLAYDTQTERWLLVDPSNLPGEEYIRPELLVDAIFNDFSAVYKTGTGALVMGTQMITTAQYAEPMKAHYDQLIKNSEWVSLHDSTKIKNADFLGLTPSTLYDRFYDHSKDVQWSDQKILDHALEAGLNDVITQLAITKGVQPFLTIHGSKLSAVFLALPLKQQQILLNQFTIERKFDFISSYFLDDRARFLFFQMLPEQERVTCFLKFKSSAQAALLKQFAQDGLNEQQNILVERLTLDEKTAIIQSQASDYNTLFFQILSEQERLPVFLKIRPFLQGILLERYAQDALTEQRNILLQALTPSEKANIISDQDKGLDYKGLSFQMLPKQERLLVFLQLQPGLQLRCLQDLLKDGRLEEKNIYLQNLSIDQKAKIIDTVSSGVDVDNSLQILPEEERLPVFINLKAENQASLLSELTRVERIEQRNALVDALSVAQKASILMRGGFSKSECFQMFREHERLPIFLKLSFLAQARVMSELTKEEFIALGGNNWLEELTIEKKVKIMSTFPIAEGGKLDTFVILYNSLPTTRRIEILQEKNQSNLMHRLAFAFFFSDHLLQMMAGFNVDECFDLIREDICRFKALPLRSLKKMLQDKIMAASPASSRFAFEGVQQHIANAESVYQLMDPLQELTHLLEHPPTMAMVVADTSALVLHDENQVGAPVKYTALKDMLLSLGLTKDTLTSSSLRKVWRKIHPDKNTLDQQTLVDAIAEMNVLKTFTSISGLVDYQQDKDIHDKVRNRLSGIMKEDELFLIHTAAATIMQHAVEGPLNAADVSEVNRFIGFNVEEHKNGLQSFEETLMMLSTIANILDNPSELKTFFDERKRGAEADPTLTPTPVASEPEPGDVSGKNNQVMIKSGITQFRTDIENARKESQILSENPKKC